MLLYSLLHLTGYDLSLEDLKHFRQWGSRTPGHPERNLTPGVEVTTGPLGQGFGNAVGMAMAEAHLSACYNHRGHRIIDHRTYVIAGDGDLMEGVASEAASLAGQWKLGKLTVLYDDNRISLAGSTDLIFTEDRAARFRAYGWHTEAVEDGNDIEAISAALERAEQEDGRPSLILVRTHIGYGSPNKQDTYEAHGSPLGADEVRLTKENLGWPLEPDFYVPEEALAEFRKAVDRGRMLNAEWRERLEAYVQEFPEESAELKSLISGRPASGWDESLPVFQPDPKGMATRVACGKAMATSAPLLLGLVGGSGDLDPSTYSALKGMGDFGSPLEPPDDTQGTTGGVWGYSGKNVHFGVREHAMGAILNGAAAHGGLIPFGATFLIFSDYMRPPIRLAALMELGVIYLFTHDSVALGEDGPTHQPVEQLSNLRAVPNLRVIRPCDANEVTCAWRVALENRTGPTALILSRQNVPVLDRAKLYPASGLLRGGYVISDSLNGFVDIILAASGSEVSLALAASDRLADQGVGVRVVSMPGWDLFDEQPKEYRDSVFPPDLRVRMSIEAAGPQGWERYLGDQGECLGVRTFGASAPGEVVLQQYGFSVDNVVDRALALLGRPL